MPPKNRLEDLISTSAFADLMNCHESTVRKAIREGRISDQCLSKNANGRLNGIDWQKAKVEWAKNYSIGKNSSSPVAEALEAEVITARRVTARGDDGEILDVAESKRRQEHYKAEKGRIELEEKAGALVSKEQVRRDLYEFGMEMRTAMQGVPDRVADDLAIETDRNKCYRIMLDGINEALRKLTDMVERDFG